MDEAALLRRHNPALHILFEGKDRHGAFSDGEGRRGHDRGHLSGEARAIYRKLAFQNRGGPRHFLVMIASDRLDDRLGPAWGDLTDADHAFAKAFQP